MYDLAEMIDDLARLVKAFVPGSLEFLWLACGLSLATLALPWRPGRQAGLGVLIAVGGVYFALSLPWAASLIASPLYRYVPLPDVSRPREAVTIVALDGDFPDGRVAETARLYRALHSKRVIVSGSPRFRAAILAAGVPSHDIVWESQARNTREQALALQDLLSHDSTGGVVLVASPLHMRRARAACEAAGVSVIPSAAARPDAGFRGRPIVVPAADALRLSYEALYEYLALAYYDLKGWTGTLG
jgi:uncharacterized SAM-binding protein YcdF (DUF218 family)